MKKTLSFQYNSHYQKWFWSIVTSLVSAFLGAVLTFAFGDHIKAALIAFSILIFFLILVCFIMMFFENRVSVLSIMNQGLVDGKYEDVIKFGNAMSQTLFTSNKNEDRVNLGKIIDEAANKIQTAHYNKSQGDYRVTFDGYDKTINLIRTSLKIDDLGWSYHLCNQDDEAIKNITLGIKAARSEAIRLRNKYSRNRDEGKKAILPYVKLIMRGYRHLCGIYYEDVTKYDDAFFYEQVTRIIMSNYSVISLGGVCEHKNPTPCGLFCDKDKHGINGCIRQSIKELYFNNINNRSATVDDTKIIDFIDFFKDQMELNDIRTDVELFNYLDAQDKEKMIKEQCYAWGRNMVKRLQRQMLQSNNTFISDEELVRKIYEAKSFAQLYYYGIKNVPDNDSAEGIFEKSLIGKSELRYLSLLNEISLIELATNETRSDIEKIIVNLGRTIELCRDKRADLYVRNSLLLMKAYFIEYDTKNRYSDKKNSNDAQKNTVQDNKAIIQTKIKQVKHIYKDIIKYEHRKDVEVSFVYKDTLDKLRMCKNELKLHFKEVSVDNDDFIVKGFNVLTIQTYETHKELQKLNDKIFIPLSSEIEKIKNKWSIE